MTTCSLQFLPFCLLLTLFSILKLGKNKLGLCFSIGLGVRVVHFKILFGLNTKM